MQTETMPSRKEHGVFGFVAFLAAGYYLPISLLWSGLIPFAYRFHMLVGMAVSMIVYVTWRKRSLKSLGLRSDTLGASLLVNGILSVILLVLTLLISRSHLVRHAVPPTWNLFYAFYVFVSSPAQEFLFRSVLFAEMEAAGIRKPCLLVAISSLTYCFLHVIYRDGVTLMVTLCMGLIWGCIYLKKPNLAGVTLSHAVLGAASIAIGLV